MIILYLTNKALVRRSSIPWRDRYCDAILSGTLGSTRPLVQRLHTRYKEVDVDSHNVTMRRRTSK
jgi:hypothetical protein